ncbi:MAG: HAMP domain-containing sensor histidine kinase, partial [Gammaproteobacteria bacterium]
MLLNRFDKGRLRLLLAAFFMALALPTVVLVYQSYDQLKWEAFHRHRVMAEELGQRIDNQMITRIAAEEARSFADYGFLVVAGDPTANFVQQSPLSQYPVNSDVPGLLGYFQVDAAGAFSSPLVPDDGTYQSYGISDEEYAARVALEQSIREVLTHNRLIRERHVEKVARESPLEESAVRRDLDDAFEVSSEKDAITISGELGAGDRSALGDAEVNEQRAFDQLKKSELSSDLEADAPAPASEIAPQRANTLGRLEDLKLDQAYADKRSREGEAQMRFSNAQAPVYRREKRKEQSAIAAPAGKVAGARAPAEAEITTFESEIDPFEFSMLGSGHFVLFRKVWRDGQRYIQGAVIERQPFIDAVIGDAFENTALSQMSDLIVAYQDDVVSAFSGDVERAYLAGSEAFSGALLYQTRLSDPIGGVQLIFTITHLPVGPAGRVLAWVSVILALVLCGGFYLLYRLGVGQIELATQQQDFVSAVSHELKTPLTSIRMYGEMLKEGWASDEKKKEYYDYIHDESERLSRLINNVLQLARMTRNDAQLEVKPVSVAALLDQVRSKIETQVRRAGFSLALDQVDDVGATSVAVDADAFTQIIINLVDNAIKFSRDADEQRIEISAREQR